MLHRLPGKTRRSLLRSTLTVAISLAAITFVSGCAERDGATAVERSPEQLFVDYCASCHGTDGSGNGPVAQELRVEPANLRLLKQKNDGQFPTRRVRGSIDGRGMPRAHGLPEMPVWGALWKRQGLSEAEVQAQLISIANYVGRLQD